jgi:flagellar basal body P-ring formation protein FlgA
MKKFYYICMMLMLLSMTAFMAPSLASASDSQIINSGWLLEVARNTIISNEPWESSGVDVQIESTPADFTVYRSGKIDVKGVLERTPGSIRDIKAVSVNVTIDGQVYMRFDPSPYLTATIETFKSNRDIKRGEVIAKSDIEKIPIDIKLLPQGDLFVSADEIAGKSAKMNISNGKILTSDLIELPVLVRRGDTVRVIITLGGAEISLNGTSLDDGVLNEEIRVRNPDSKSIIRAIVTGPGQAKSAHRN